MNSTKYADKKVQFFDLTEDGLSSILPSPTDTFTTERFSQMVQRRSDSPDELSTTNKRALPTKLPDYARQAQATWSQLSADNGVDDLEPLSSYL